MIVRCPVCGTQNSLDALVEHEAAAEALNMALKLVPCGGLIRGYLGLFRPPARSLSMTRVVKLLDELLPVMQAQRIERDGKVFDAPLAVWAAGLEKCLQARDSGQLRTPLKSHGYLFEIVIAEAARAPGGRNPIAPADGATGLRPASAAAKSMDVLSERRRGINAD